MDCKRCLRKMLYSYHPWYGKFGWHCHECRLWEIPGIPESQLALWRAS